MTDSSHHAPLAPARRAHVLALLARDGAVRVSQLIDELGVTPVTLRRDLALMEQEGLLVRVHGGAVAPASVRPGDDAAPARGRADAATGASALAVLVPSLN